MPSMIVGLFVACVGGERIDTDECDPSPFLRGFPDPVPSSTVWRSFTVGIGYVCAAPASFGPISCWGDLAPPNVNPPSGVFSKMSASSSSVCGLDIADGRVRCSDTVTGEPFEAPGLGHVDFDGSIEGGCAMDAAGAATCWGRVAGANDGVYSAISVGREACGIRASDGGLECWTTEDEGTPLPGSFTFIDAGARGWCGTTVDGLISCQSGTEMCGVGADSYSSLSNGDAMFSRGFLCARGVETWTCWDEDGVQLDHPFGVDIVDLQSSPTDFLCGMDRDGHIACWGGAPAP